MIRSGYSMDLNVIIIALILKHLSVSEDALWVRLSELTLALPTPAWRLWRAVSLKLSLMKKVAGLRLRWLDSPRPANGWWGRSPNGRPSPILKTRFTRSSGSWDAAMTR